MSTGETLSVSRAAWVCRWICRFPIKMRVTLFTIFWALNDEPRVLRVVNENR